MKILVASQYWYPENGVPQRRWRWLTRVLQEAGHEVAVIAPPPHYKRRVTLVQWARERGYRLSLTPEKGPNGETIYRSGYFPAETSLTYRILNQGWTAFAMIVGATSRRSALADFGPDIIIGTVPALPTAVVTLIASKRLQAPYIIDLRDAWPALFRESREWNRGVGRRSLRERILTKGPFQALLWITENAIRYVLDHASGIITTSQLLERQVQKSNGQITATVRNVFPAEVSRAYVRGTRDRDVDVLNVLYAGTLGRAQRLENALQAAAIARNVYGIQVRLKLVGDGAAKFALAKQIAVLKIDAELLPQRSPENLKDFYAWADTALVHLTGWDSLKSAIPSKTYELMRMGVHITAVVAGETAELVTHLEAGGVVSPDNPEALAELWSELVSNRSRLNISRKGQAWVENEQRDIAPRRLLEMIDTVQRRHGEGIL